jgi:DNA-binding cell septation regulator SpoVG
MAIELQKIKYSDKGNLKATFSAKITNGDDFVILPNLRAVSGSKGVFVELAGKNVKDAKTEKWTHIPHYYVSKTYKQKIEELIIEQLSKRG